MSGGETLQYGDTAALRPLDWDTAFFGFPCARLDLTGEVSQTALQSALDAARSYPFLCIANHGNRPENNRLLGLYSDAFLADTNVQFEKNGLMPTGKQTLFAADRFPEDAGLLGIARTVFTASRFVTDEKLRRARGGEVYVQWAKNAFGQSGKYYMTTKRDGQVCGFLLFSVEASYLRLELIGVDRAAQSGGVGRLLWENLEHEAAARHKQGILVGTQLANTGAIRFYTGRGCRLVSSNTIYHRWL